MSKYADTNQQGNFNKAAIKPEVPAQNSKSMPAGKILPSQGDKLAKPLVDGAAKPAAKLGK